MTPMLKVIFLDIDGVLNSSEGFEREYKAGNKAWNMLDIALVNRLNQLLEITGASVVLSSTWRCDSNWRETLAAGGVNVQPFVGATPRQPRPVGAGWEYNERGREIALWLNKHPQYTRYAIIDDDSDMLPEQLPNFFQTSNAKGLSDDVVGRVVSHLST